MILIIDSGSFKADWILLTQSSSIQLQTQGLNPYFIDFENTKNELKKISEIQINKKEIKQIFFYGAGCSSYENTTIIYKILQWLFPVAKIKIETDLAGAAKALFKKDKGIACILGTGSNCCFYDGANIVKQTPSLGYILGDEGSGAYMGKMLIKKYLHNQLGEDLKTQLEKDYKLNQKKILKAIYQEGFPNRYLANFSEFIYKYKQKKDIQNIINQSLDKFFNLHVSKLTEHTRKVGFVGSIAWIFKDNILTIAENYGLHIDEIIQSPIINLTKIHEKDII
jgi:N-acetylglucosamine kinase-like BadF-type ATPase